MKTPCTLGGEDAAKLLGGLEDALDRVSGAHIPAPPYAIGALHSRILVVVARPRRARPALCRGLTLA